MMGYSRLIVIVLTPSVLPDITAQLLKQRNYDPSLLLLVNCSVKLVIHSFWPLPCSWIASIITTVGVR